MFANSVHKVFILHNFRNYLGEQKTERATDKLNMIFNVKILNNLEIGMGQPLRKTKLREINVFLFFTQTSLL